MGYTLDMDTTNDLIANAARGDRRFLRELAEIRREQIAKRLADLEARRARGFANLSR